MRFNKKNIIVSFLFFVSIPGPLIAQSPGRGIDPLVLGLRDALYADALLEELVDQLEILPAVQKPIALIRQGKAREALALLEKRPDRDAFVPAVVRILAYKETANRARALGLLKGLAGSEDTRIGLQSFRLLREFGVKPASKKARQPMGAIVESTGASGPLVIAGFLDGSARIYYRDGKTLRDGGRATVQAAARKLTAALGRRIDRLRPEKNRNLPGAGLVRFALLTPGGVLVTLVQEKDLSNPRHPLAAAFAAASALKKAIGQAK